MVKTTGGGGGGKDEWWWWWWWVQVVMVVLLGGRSIGFKGVDSVKEGARGGVICIPRVYFGNGE